MEAEWRAQVGGYRKGVLAAHNVTKFSIIRADVPYDLPNESTGFDTLSDRVLRRILSSAARIADSKEGKTWHEADSR